MVLNICEIPTTCALFQFRHTYSHAASGILIANKSYCEWSHNDYKASECHGVLVIKLHIWFRPVHYVLRDLTRREEKSAECHLIMRTNYDASFTKNLIQKKKSRAVIQIYTSDICATMAQSL